jgi:hypothetical protein
VNGYKKNKGRDSFKAHQARKSSQYMTDMFGKEYDDYDVGALVSLTALVVKDAAGNFAIDVAAAA